MGSAEYTPSALVRALHETPRLNFQFRPATSQFSPEDRDYDEGLASLAIFFLLLGIVVLGLSIYGICCGDETGDEEKQRPPPTTGEMQRKRTCVSVASVILILVCGTLAIVTHEFTLAVGSIQTEASSAVTRFESVTTQGADLSDQLLATVTVTSELQTSDDNATAAKNDLIAGCQSTRDAVLSLVDEHSTLPFNDTMINDAVDDYLRYLMYGGGGMAGLVAVPALGLLLGARIRGPIWLQCCSFLYVTIMFIVTILSGLELAGSVGMSDFCIDPDTYLISLLNGSDVSEISFYLDCTPTSVSPYASYVSEANTAMNMSQTAWNILDDLVPKSDPTSRPLLQQLSQDLDLVRNSVDGLEASVSCGPFHKNFRSSVDAACFQGLDTLFASAILHVCSVILILIATLMAKRLWPLYRTKTVPYSAMNSTHMDERSPWHSPQQASFGTFQNGQVPSRPESPPPWYQEVANGSSGGERNEPPPPWYEQGATSSDAGARDSESTVWPPK